MNNEEIQQQKIILFDGVCNLCNNSVTFILNHEREPVFRFASIQSEAGKELLEWCGLPGDYTEAIVFIDRGTVHLGSTAALKIGQQFRPPWSFFAPLGLMFPKSLRNWVYHQIALHRYRWFGKRDVCIVPTDNLRIRFL